MPPFNNNRKRRANDGYAPAAPKRGRSSAGASTGSTTASSGALSQNPQVDDEGNTYWEIANKRRVTISEFRGKKYVSIREYFEKDGRDLPGKKGIALSVEQFSALIDVLPQIDRELKTSGNTISRPVYGGAGSTSLPSLPSLPPLPARAPPLPSRAAAVVEPAKKAVKEVKSAERVVESEEDDSVELIETTDPTAADGQPDAVEAVAAVEGGKESDKEGSGEDDEDEDEDEDEDDEQMRMIAAEMAQIQNQADSDEEDESEEE